MINLTAAPEALAGAASASSTTAAVTGAGAAATATPMSAVAPGTLSPEVVAATARIVAHGANRLAMAEAGAAMVAMVSAAYGTSSLSYEVTELGNTAALSV